MATAKELRQIGNFERTGELIMINRQNLSKMAAFGVAMPSLLLSAQQPERIVRDLVQTRPVRDQYADLLRASERLDAGRRLLADKQLQQYQSATA